VLNILSENPLTSQGHIGCACPAVIKHEQLHETVMQAVVCHIDDCRNIRSGLQRLRSNTVNLFNLEERLKKERSYLARQNELKCSAYEYWKLGAVSKEDYLTITLEIDARIQKKQKWLLG